MEPQDISATQKAVVDRLHEIQRKAESGKFTDALAIIKEVKNADSKNIYLIAIEKQIAKLCDSALPEDSRNGIVKSLPSMLDRAIGDIQRRASAAKVDESQKEQKEAALEKLKSQYFQRADDYVEKHEYQRALEEIRRIYIIEPGSVVAKEYEQKIEQLSSIHARNEAEKAASEEQKETKEAKGSKETKVIKEEVKESKAETKKAKKAVEEPEPQKEKTPVILEEDKKKSKLPILIAAAVVVIAVGSWLIFSQKSSNTPPVDQQQTQQQPAQDSIALATPQNNITTAQPKVPAVIAEAPKQTPKNEKKQPESKPTPQSQKPAQTTAQQPSSQPSNTKPQTTQNPPAAQTQQPAQQQPAATTTSTPAPMPFVAIEIQPEVIRREPAKYPEMAIKMGLTGRVTVEVTIDPQGKPIQAKVVKSANEVFNDAAIEAVMKYTYKPAMQSNSPVTAKMFIPIDFRLK